jgi:hypothetical protein
MRSIEVDIEYAYCLELCYLHSYTAWSHSNHHYLLNAYVTYEIMIVKYRVK